MGGGLTWWAGPRVASPGEKLARAAGPSREARGGAVHVLLEALHLADGAVADLGALVPLGDGDVKPGELLAVAGGRPAGLLDEQGEGGDLEEDAELGHGGGGGDVGEDPLLLHDDLENVGDHPTGVAEGVLLSQKSTSLEYSGLSWVARRFPGLNILPSLIWVVSFTCRQVPSSSSRNSWHPGKSLSARQKTVRGP